MIKFLSNGHIKIIHSSFFYILMYLIGLSLSKSLVHVSVDYSVTLGRQPLLGMCKFINKFHLEK